MDEFIKILKQKDVNEIDLNVLKFTCLIKHQPQTNTLLTYHGTVDAEDKPHGIGRKCIFMSTQTYVQQGVFIHNAPHLANCTSVNEPTTKMNKALIKKWMQQHNRAPGPEMKSNETIIQEFF